MNSLEKKVKSILIVEDDPVIVTIGWLLEREGYLPALFDNGFEAIAAIKNGLKYDLAFFDYHVGSVRGNELTDVSKNMNPLVPVIIRSAWPNPEIYAANSYLSKLEPFDKFLEIIKKYLP